MSVASKNPFALLGDETEQAVPSTPRGISAVDKKSTSSKKTDALPAKADAARANKNRKGPTGNEAAFRSKTAGHAANKAVPAPENTSRAKKGRGRTDRHSGTGKKDTDKQVKKGWGDDNKILEDEQAAETIAKNEEEEDEQVAQQEADNTQTLEEYLAELNMKTSGLEGQRSIRKANDGNDDQWKTGSTIVKAEENFFESSKTKTLRTKNKKEKTVLEPELNFSAPREERSSRGGAGGSRGGRPSNNRRGGPSGNNNSNGRRGGASAGFGRGRQGGPKTTVNIANQEEFPSLGA